MTRMRKLFCSNVFTILLGIGICTSVSGENLNGKYLFCEPTEGSSNIYTLSFGWEFTDSSVYQWGNFPSLNGVGRHSSKEVQEVTYQLFSDEIVISYWSPRFERVMRWGTLNRNTLVMKYTPVMTTSINEHQCELVGRTEMTKKIETKIKTYNSKREQQNKQKYPERKL